MLRPGRLNITIDGQFGSTGKGVLNAFLALRTTPVPDICVTNAAPNAGHTFIDRDGQRRTCFHLPVSGVLTPDAHIYLAAGSIIDPVILLREIADFSIVPDRIKIDPRACILSPEHTQREQAQQSGATALASTRKGVGAALADKVARVPGVRIADACEELNPYVGRRDLMRDMDAGKTVLMEVPQGFGLSINHGLSYPHCTSRDITIGAALNDAGVHPAYLGAVIASIRTYPIRVGNIVEEGREIGFSGPFYPDSIETTWAALGLPDELTTVTKRVRRVATFSLRQYADMLRHLRPDAVFLNFANHLSGADALADLRQKMRSVETNERMTPVHLIGFGPDARDVRTADEAEMDAGASWQGRAFHHG